MNTASNPDKSSIPGNPDVSVTSGHPTDTTHGAKRGLLFREAGGKPLWDWLDLSSKLAIPVVVLIVTIGFGWWQSVLSGRQHAVDENRTLNQQQAAILETYIGTMRDLLLNHGLSTSAPGAQVRQVAREQTLAMLPRLNANRNRIVLQFLQDARLIGTRNPVIDLSNANLSYNQLNGAHLSGIDLIGADLSHADLIGADLSGATMYGADLAKARLRNAILEGSSLSDASLSDANLAGAHLSNAFLTSAVLTGADLQGATLTVARLNGADLAGVNLSGANLSGADLTGANLARANLAGANLSGTTGLTASLNGARGAGAGRGNTGHTCANTAPSARQTRHHSVKLTYWYTESGTEATKVQQLINKFMQKYPRITVCGVQKPFLQTQAAFATAVQSGQAPDVLRCDVGWSTRFASEGYLLNIDSFISGRALSDYLTAPLRYDRYKGHLYGLPQVTDFLALLYNNKELKKAGVNRPPATMAALKADAVKVVKRNAARYGFQTTGTSYYALPFLYAFGGGMFAQHNNILVNSAGSVKGLKFLLRLENNPNYVMPAGVTFDNGLSDMEKKFRQGKTAMIFDGPYALSALLRTPGSVFYGHPGRLGIAAIPRGPTGTAGSPLGGQSYVIFAGTKHPAEAYKFISFMSSNASQVALAKTNLTLPTRRSAYRGKVTGNRFIREFLHIRKTAIARPAIPQGAYLFDMFDPNIWAALLGVQSPKDALNAVADSWNQLGAGQLLPPSR